jgi:long-subunit fatty acid transport protein
MQRSTLSLAIAVAVLALTGSADVLAKKAKPGHQFKGSVEVQYRSNDNISIAPSSGQRFDYANVSEFGIEDEDAIDAEGGDEFEDAFDDLVDIDPSEDEIEADDAIDEDIDGIDDLIDPNADNVVDEESRFSTKLAFAHRYTFANGSTSWNNGLRFATDTHNQRDDLDKFNWAITTGLAFAPRGSRHSVRPSLSYVALDKNSNKFSSTFVASLAYGYRVSKQLNVSATYNYQDKDISNPRAPDARIDTLEFGAEFEATDNDIFKLEFAPKVEDSTVFTRNTDAWGWEVAYTRRLPWDMTAGVGYRFNTIDYKNLTPNREDDNRVWGVQLARSFGKQFVVELGYESGKRDSNIPSKDASNESLYFGGTWKF